MRDQVETSVIGRITDGLNNASHWLKSFNEAYSSKLGLNIVPGSLNLFLEEEFYLSKLLDRSKTIRMGGEEYGGQRDILMRPCKLFDRLCYIWRTENAENGLICGFDFRLIEIISDVHLRSTFSLAAGDRVSIDVL